MIYQLPNGKIVNISIEAYLRMSDDELKYLNESNIGSHIGDKNPFDVNEDLTEDLHYVDENIEELPEEIDFLDCEDFDEE